MCFVYRISDTQKIIVYPETFDSCQEALQFVHKISKLSGRDLMVAELDKWLAIESDKFFKVTIDNGRLVVLRLPTES